MNVFKQKHKLRSIFITAGFPKRDSLPEQLHLLQAKGMDIIEIGIPFSDPLADGPTIQHSSEIALQNGMHLGLLFEQLTTCRKEIHVPLVLMGYFNPILNYGLEKFLKQCQELQIAGLIIPDLSMEILEARYAMVFKKYNIPYIPIVSPVSDNSRIEFIANKAKQGFVYLVGQNATTGSAISFEAHQERYREIKNLCGDTPLLIGFGIRTNEDVKTVSKHADGAIIGSAYLQAIMENRSIAFLESLNT